tara:strand:+ start:12014 stop:12907 length:894 start_codon:yes stop_codon:yes gene_type:complete
MSLKDMVKSEDKGQLVETRYQMNKRRILTQRKRDEEKRQTYLICSISGEAKIGKSGIALDCRTEEEIKEGWTVYVLDFDNGAKSTWQSQWDSDENLWIFNPWILSDEGHRNYEATADNAHDFVRFVRERIEDGEKVKSFVLDGVDKWLECCSQMLRLAITKSGKIRDADLTKVPTLAWGRRKREYYRLLEDDILDSGLDCHKFFITHLKPKYAEGNIHEPIIVDLIEDWEKSTEALFTQTIRIRKAKNAEGDIVSRATLTSSKTNTNLVGSTWDVLTIKTKGDNVWKGITELKEGKL